MNTSTLRDLFNAISAKYLTRTDADPDTSHGHEIGGLSTMRRCWGNIEDRKAIPARFVYLDNSNDEPLESSGFISWYNSRRMEELRSPEWRVYYNDNDVVQRMQAGDFIVLAQLKDGSPFFIAAPAGSNGEFRVKTLFGITNILTKGHIEFTKNNENIPLDFQSRYILDALGIEYNFDDENLIDIITDAFGNDFPTTRQFSEFARNYAIQTKILSLADSSPDDLIMDLYETEELLFRTFEKKLISRRLELSFKDSDEFVDYAKSVMNRRSARAGFALENHIEYILKMKDIGFTRGAKTENKTKPDFIFPSIDKYRDKSFPSNLLTLLAVKSSCKDRWRQALAEADRVDSIKHLLTLEPSISENQTNEMQSRQLQLVVPLKLHNTFSESQKSWLWTFEQFTNHVKLLQKNMHNR